MTVEATSTESNVEFLNRNKLASLDAQRTALEEEAQSITMKLTSPTGDDGRGPPMGIDTPLVDIDGYPRADIDLFLARSLRGRLAEIRNDHKLVMKDIETLLLQLPAVSNNPQQQLAVNEQQARLAKKPKPKYDPVTGKWVVKNWDGTISGAGEANGDGIRSFDAIDEATPPLVKMSNLYVVQPKQQQQLSSTAPSTTTTTRTTAATSRVTSTTFALQDNAPAIPTIPFAKVHAVAPESPAAQAGLLENDLILQFGTISKQSCLAKGLDPFEEVAKLVPLAAGEQQSITIMIEEPRGIRNIDSNVNRDPSSVVALQLTPKPWNGRGLLGCLIIPV